MIYPYLYFFTNGSEVRIVYSGTEKSMDYETKISVLRKTINSVKEGKISFGKFIEFKKSILKAINLAWSKENPAKVELTRLHVIKGLHENLLIALSEIKSLDELRAIPEAKEVKEAYFIVCPDGEKHGRFFTKEGMLWCQITSKKFALVYIQELKHHKIIDELEVKKLQKEVQKSSLPIHDPVKVS